MSLKTQCGNLKNFTWNQFLKLQKLLFWGSEDRFWYCLQFMIQKFAQKYETAKNAFFELLVFSKLISRKIWEEEKCWYFHTSNLLWESEFHTFLPKISWKQQLFQRQKLLDYSQDKFQILIWVNSIFWCNLVNQMQIKSLLK